MDPVQEKRSIGPIVGIIVIIAVLIVGAFYVWGGKLSSSEPGPLTSTDEVSDIQSDLDAGIDVDIDLSDIDAGL
jgi:hypothetical protein